MNRRHWPAALILFAILIFGSYLLYTEQMVREIRRETATQMQLYGLVQRGLLSPDQDGAIKSLLDMAGAISQLNIPIVIVNSAGDPYATTHLPFKVDLVSDTGKQRVLQYAARLQRENMPLVVGDAGRVYFGSPPILRWLRWIPWFQ